MIRLYVDGVEMTPKDNNSIMPRYDLSMLRDIDAWRSGKDIEVVVESSQEVDRVLQHAGDMHRAEAFNSTLHEARLTLDGTTIFEGHATLKETDTTKGTRSYTLRLRSGGAEWAKRAATTPFSQSDIECNTSLTIADIEHSWSDDSPITFLPLQRDSYPKPTEAGLYAVEHVLMPHEYHPFIAIRPLIEAFIKGSGYRLKSDFMESDLFRRLMLSGAYSTTDSAVAERAMGFKAYRSTTSSAQASQSGKVDICAPLIASNVGPIVDTTNDMAKDDGGRRFSDAYSNGGCMNCDSGEPIFTPTREISVAFEYFIHYTTECRMVSSTHMQGFTTIHLANDCNVDVILQNPYTDRRNDLMPYTRYKLIVFDHSEGNTYKLSGIGDELSNECSVVTSTKTGSSTSLYFRPAAGGAYIPFYGDWALYDGHVTRDSSREIMLTVRTPYEKVTPTSPKNFNNLYIGGAIEGQQLTLHSGCSVRPIFGGSVGYGNSITFKDIAHHNFSQAELLGAIAQMFNLCIYSHKSSKMLYIEPYDKFFNGEVVDWRSRQRDGNWAYEEGEPTCFERTRLCYAGNDGVVKRTTGEEDNYGEWIYSTSGYSAKMGTNTITNPILYPTVCFTESTTTAPSAEVLTVGDRDKLTDSDYVEPRIVLYHGMRPLPENERWQAYNTLCSYPFAAFHSPNADATLSFSDSDGLQGLHQYYDRELRECSERGVLTCLISMRPDEYIDLLDPASDSANIRSQFRLKTEYGSSLFILTAIEGYDAATQTAKCRFRRMLTD